MVDKRLVADLPPALIVALAIVAMLFVALIVFLVVGVRRNQRRFVANANTAPQYGFRGARVAPPWKRFLPEGGSGILGSVFEGHHRGRPVVLAEYLYRHYYRVLGPISSHHRSIRLAVVALRLREPRPPRYGDAPGFHWQCVGPDLLAWVEGELRLPDILRLVDQLEPIAEWLEANP